MCSDIMEKVAGCKADGTPATLANYFRSRISGEEYPGIIATDQKSVKGIAYFDLPGSAVSRLDSFEGEMYERLKVQVTLQDKTTVSAFAYVFKQQYQDLLTGEQWNFEDFLASGKKKFEDAYFGFQTI